MQQQSSVQDAHDGSPSLTTPGWQRTVDHCVDHSAGHSAQAAADRRLQDAAESHPRHFAAGTNTLEVVYDSMRLFYWYLHYIYDLILYLCIMYYTVCYLTGIFYAVVRQISVLLLDSKKSCILYSLGVSSLRLLWYFFFVCVHCCIMFASREKCESVW